ncbi:MAG TPA: M13 family metallopeptidase [Kofleriaceae bacterium]|nr:M13 family metallopeptidase [Kofleriaceae bacterium]
MKPRDLPARAAVACAFLACSGPASQTPVQPDQSATQPAPAAPAHAMTLAESGIVPDWLDRSVDPCQDFYAFSCGGFMKTAEIPPDRTAWGAIQLVVKENEDLLRKVLEAAAADGVSDPAQKKIGDYYAACMDEEAVEKAGTAPLDPFMAVIARVKDAKSAADAVIELQTIGLAPFFGLTPTQDYGDATQVIASVDQAGLGLPDRDYYWKDEGSMKSVRTAYRAHVGRMFALLGKKPAEVEAAVASTIRIETAIARAQQDKVFRRDPHHIYHRIDRVGLEKVAPGFPWGALLERLGIGGVTAITANDPKYYAAITRIIAREKPAALRSYLTWTLVSGMASALSRPFVDEEFAFEKVVSGMKQLPPRWRRCYDDVDRDLGQLLGQSYVAQRFGGQSKPRAIELTRAILAAMGKELETLPWMDAPTRAAAQKKLVKMAYLVGFPDTWRVYDFEVSRTSHATNVLAAARFELHRQLAKIGRPVDRNDWLMTPPTVNAYYEPTLNELALPAGQLQPPFFKDGFHPAVNFGATGGGTIGHEMTHGFDDEGSQFDSDGNLKDWWSPPTGEKFKQASQCVIDQYARYEAVPGTRLDGKLTAGENIADIGGVKIAYRAYQDWRAAQSVRPPAVVDGFTDDQLYFMSYAQSWCMKVNPERLEVLARSDPHSPPEWRVKGVVVDQPGFAEAFQCRAGAPMRPDKSCAVW